MGRADYMEQRSAGAFLRLLIRERELAIERQKRERPLFEANYVENGGDIENLIWVACTDDLGAYEPDWSNIGKIEHPSTLDKYFFKEKIVVHATHVNQRLESWVQSVTSKENAKLLDEQREIIQAVIHKLNSGAK